MRICSRQESQRLDQLAQEQFKISSEKLMEAAGSSVAEEIHAKVKNKKSRILLLIGPGNNGADGFVVARLLKRKSFTNLVCVVVREKNKPSQDWLFQQSKAQNSGVEILRLTEDRLRMEINNSEVVVEAIFGSGFKGPIDAGLVSIVDFLNSKDRLIVAVDSPIGLDINTGAELPVALRAGLTVSFGLAKLGFFVGRGPRCIGKLKVHQIGFPKSLIQRECHEYFAWGNNSSRMVLPQRDELSNKSTHGVVNVLAGSSEYPGAGLLTANAAGRAGAGYVYLLGSPDVYKHVQMIPEVILRSRQDLDFKQLDRESCIAIGPGLGTGEESEKLVRELIRRKFEKVVVDADAISVIAHKKIFPLPSTWILTPHAGELSELMGKSAKSLNADRFSAVKEASQLTGAIVLFKGFRTVISGRLLEKNETKTCVILSGNSALAKAGSGDVLTGFISAFLAQGLEPFHAAALGAYLHGRLSRDWLLQKKDIISLLPSDLSGSVPILIRKIRESK